MSKKKLKKNGTPVNRCGLVVKGKEGIKNIICSQTSRYGVR